MAKSKLPADMGDLADDIEEALRFARGIEAAGKRT